MGILRARWKFSAPMISTLELSEMCCSPLEFCQKNCNFQFSFLFQPTMLLGIINVWRQGRLDILELLECAFLLTVMYLDLFLCATAECFTRFSYRLGVRLSITPWHCIKTVQAKITESLPLAAPRSLVFRDKILCSWVWGFPSNEGIK